MIKVIKNFPSSIYNNQGILVDVDEAIDNASIMRQYLRQIDWDLFHNIIKITDEEVHIRIYNVTSIFSYKIETPEILKLKSYSEEYITMGFTLVKDKFDKLYVKDTLDKVYEKGESGE